MKWDGPEEGHGLLSKFHLSRFLDLTPSKNRKCKTSPLGVPGLGESSCSREWLAEDEMQKHMQTLFGQVPKHTANQSSRHLSVKSGGRQNGAARRALQRAEMEG